MEKIADFTVLPILYGKSTQHFLYIKEHTWKPHSEKATTFPNGRALFLVNIPPDATERELTLFFKPCGHVERVIMQSDIWSPEAYGAHESSEAEDEVEEVTEAIEDATIASKDDSIPRRKRRKISGKNQQNQGPPPQVTPLPQPEIPLRSFCHSGSSAHIVFTDMESVSRALALRSASPIQRTWPPATGVIPLSGLAHYAELHKVQRPSLQDVKTHADTYLDVYEYNKALKRQRSEYRKGDAVVDEDGFTLVTRGGAYGTTLGGGVGVASKKFMNNMSTGESAPPGKRSKKKPKRHETFYKFQIHEKQRKELADLKAGFDKDKESIARLKESRFKPY